MHANTTAEAKALSSGGLIYHNSKEKTFLFLLGLTPAIQYYPVFFMLLISILSIRSYSIFRNYISIFLVYQYALVGIFFSVFHSGDFGVARLDKHYLILIAASPFLLSYISANKNNLLNYMSKYLSIGILTSIIIIFSDFLLEFNGRRCEAWGFTFNHLASPMLFPPLIALIFSRFANCSSLEKILPLLALVFVVVSTSALSGARMGFYILMLVTFLILIKEVLERLRGKQSSVIPISVALLVAIVFAAVIDGHFSCGFAKRVGQTFLSAQHTVNYILMPNVVQEPKSELLRNSDSSVDPLNDVGQALEILPAPGLTADVMIEKGMPNSEAIRLALWVNAIEAIKERPFIGYGVTNERAVITERAGVESKFASHNQYLSWLLWGGIPTLLSGLVLFAIVASGGLSVTSVLVALSWALSFVTDQPLLFPQILIPFLLTLALAGIINTSSGADWRIGLKVAPSRSKSRISL